MLMLIALCCCCSCELHMDAGTRDCIGVIFYLQKALLCSFNLFASLETIWHKD